MKYQKEFDQWIKDNGYDYYINSWFDKENHSLDCNTEQLYQYFLEEYDKTIKKGFQE